MAAVAAQEPLRGRGLRESAFDILKAIGIIEVMLHHSLSHSSRKYTLEGSTEWWFLMMANRVLHFAIPVFLLASALLLARSLAKRDDPDWRRFFWRRAQRTLWPYLLWTGIYILFRVTVLQVGSDIYPREGSFFGFTWFGPTLLTDPREIANALVWGKGYFHLYFLSVLLQMSLLFPMLYWGLRRLKLSFGAVALVAIVGQLAMYYYQANFLRFPTPASLVTWYIPSIIIGTWLGLNWSEWPEIWRRSRASIATVTSVGLAVYLYLCTLQLSGSSFSSFAYNVSFLIYGTGMALLLLALAQHLQDKPSLAKPLSFVGNISLPLFVMHPLVLYYVSGPTITRLISDMPFSPFWSFALVFSTTLGLTALAVKTRADLFLFGRRLADTKEPPRSPERGGDAVRPRMPDPEPVGAAR